MVKSVADITDNDEAKAVILPASLALDPPDGLRKWLKAFGGDKIVVGEAGSGWVLNVLTPEQAARSARQVAEGDEVRLARPSPSWNVIQTIAVVIVGVEILFFLFALGISMVGL